MGELVEQRDKASGCWRMAKVSEVGAASTTLVSGSDVNHYDTHDPMILDWVQRVVIPGDILGPDLHEGKAQEAIPSSHHLSMESERLQEILLQNVATRNRANETIVR